MGRNLIALVSKTCGHRQADLAPDQARVKTVKNQILTLSDPKIRGQEPKTLSKRAHNPLLKEAGLTKPTAAHPSGGPVAGGAIGTSGMPLTA
jgi:hypothetical protein